MPNVVHPPPTTAYILRTCNADGSSSNGFVWPLTPGAEVICPDWDPTPECGHGLHGFLNGEGDGNLANWSPDAVWLVVSAPAATLVDLGGKVKFPRCVVRFAGTRPEATALIAELAPGHAVIGGTATAGHGGTATAGHWGTATAGHGGTATAGYGGTATAGYGGTATAGHGGTATAGYGGTATAGYGGTATAGDRGTLVIKWWDGDRYRLAVGYVGEDRIKAGNAYRVDGGRFVEVAP